MGMEDNWDDYRIVWESGDDAIVKPKYKVGDILWVREKTCYVHLEHAPDLLQGFKSKRQIIYGTDFHDDWMVYAKEKYGYKWTPSIFMAKHHARLFLKVKSVRVERLQDISEDDAVKEGIEPTGNMSMFNKFYKNYLPIGYTDLKPIPSFQSLWQSINGKQSWSDNPLVWVIEFERIQKPSFLISN